VRGRWYGSDDAPDVHGRQQLEFVVQLVVALAVVEFLEFEFVVVEQWFEQLVEQLVGAIVLGGRRSRRPAARPAGLNRPLRTRAGREPRTIAPPQSSSSRRWSW
jgi:hypothetical protein